MAIRKCYGVTCTDEILAFLTAEGIRYHRKRHIGTFVTDLSPHSLCEPLIITKEVSP